MRQDKKPVDDPLLQQAVLDLFKANREFSQAYETFQQSGDRELLARAETRVDRALASAAAAQSLARED